MLSRVGVARGQQTHQARRILGSRLSSAFRALLRRLYQPRICAADTVVGLARLSFRYAEEIREIHLTELRLLAGKPDIFREGPPGWPIVEHDRLANSGCVGIPGLPFKHWHTEVILV